MKKFVLGLLIAATLVSAVYGQRAAKSSATLKVGATVVPHAELLNLVKADLAKQGITLQVVEYQDYVQPNEALVSGDLDANYFQHLPYLQSNERWNNALATAFGVHVEPLGLYSAKLKKIGDLKNGAVIGIPNDPSNGGRALLLLQANKLITLKDGTANLSPSPRDITANPKNLQFRELEAAQLPRSLPDLDAAVINGNYALQAGFTSGQALIIEGADSPYVNYVVVRKGSENDPRILALKKALLTTKVKNYIKKKWGGANAELSVIAAF
ncbi:MAG: MetQ/NlpA family ABC transporter substrate-binding protein [Treponema sp.]|nr:MetQ/NlpA family ABC transporter substrate-binding protein [Treponema sp.]